MDDIFVTQPFTARHVRFTKKIGVWLPGYWAVDYVGCEPGWEPIPIICHPLAEHILPETLFLKVQTILIYIELWTSAFSLW